MPTAGYAWVWETKLYFIDADGFKRAQEGTLTGATGTPGYGWPEGDNIHYIDAYGDERWLPTENLTDIGTPGYSWVETVGAQRLYVHYIRAGGVRGYWHEDTAHSDADHSDVAHEDYNVYGVWSNHTNVPFSNHTAYSEAGLPPAHLDYTAHDNIPFSNWNDHSVFGDHSDSHTDVPHEDIEHDDEPALV